MAILSIQSSVAAGYVGNSAAVFPLQLLGFDVWRVDTVAYSNHPAHGRHKGRIVASDDVAALLDGLEELSLFNQCDGVISGYLGCADTGIEVVRAIARIRTVRPEVPYLCDPVFGDGGKIYVDDTIISFYRDSGIPAATIVTPNAFEASYLTGIETTTVDGALSAAKSLRAMGPRIAAVTGVAGGGKYHTVAVSETGACRVTTPLADTPGHGAGDTFSALLLGHLLKGSDLPDALSRSVSSVHALLALAPDQPGLDLPLVAGQQFLLEPPHVFQAEPIG